MSETPSLQDQKKFLAKATEVLTPVSLAIGILLGIVKLCQIFHIDHLLVQFLKNKQAVLWIVDRIDKIVSLCAFFTIQAAVGFNVCLYILGVVLFDEKHPQKLIRRLSLLLLMYVLYGIL